MYSLWLTYANDLRIQKKYFQNTIITKIEIQPIRVRSRSPFRAHLFHPIRAAFSLCVPRVHFLLFFLFNSECGITRRATIGGRQKLIYPRIIAANSISTESGAESRRSVVGRSGWEGGGGGGSDRGAEGGAGGLICINVHNTMYSVHSYISIRAVRRSSLRIVIRNCTVACKQVATGGSLMPAEFAHRYLGALLRYPLGAYYLPAARALLSRLICRNT